VDSLELSLHIAVAVSQSLITIVFLAGLAANELNGASTSTHPVGKPNLPSSVRLNLEVPRPELMPAAFPVEQGPAAVEPTVCFTHGLFQWKRLSIPFFVHVLKVFSCFTVCFLIEADT